MLLFNKSGGKYFEMRKVFIKIKKFPWRNDENNNIML